MKKHIAPRSASGGIVGPDVAYVAWGYGESVDASAKTQLPWAISLNTPMEAREPAETILIPLTDVLRMTSLSRSSVYKLASRGEFPGQVELSANRVAWLKSDIEDWIATRATQRSSTIGSVR